MSETVVARRKLLENITRNQTPDSSQVELLDAALRTLLSVAGDTEDKTGTVSLAPGKTIAIDLSYEIDELRKDLLFLSGGENTLIAQMESIHPDFKPELRATVKFLSQGPFENFITDRDGTVNNYCSRYQTSVQSLYNALFLQNFCRRCVRDAVVITSAPLRNTGIVDISVNSPRDLIFGASKGREFLDRQEKYHHYPIDSRKQQLLDRLNSELREMMSRPEYEKFLYIGSGMQFKFGQTTVARQNINQSIEPEESVALLEKLTQLVRKLDPAGEDFRIEDTGKDVEIILTVASADGSSLKDFDKTEGVRYIAGELGMSRAPTLVCGDTFSDVPLIQGALGLTEDVAAVFVTTDPALKEKVRATLPNSHFVSGPDILVCALHSLSQQS